MKYYDILRFSNVIIQIGNEISKQDSLKKR